MRTLFQMGFASRDGFWMGDLVAAGTYAVTPDIWQQAKSMWEDTVDWIETTPNYKDLLGSDAGQFQAAYAEAKGIYDSSFTNVDIVIQGDGTLSQAGEVSAETFIHDANIVYNLMQAHTGQATVPAPAPATTPPMMVTEPPQSPIPQSSTQPQAAPKPAPAPRAPGTAPGAAPAGASAQAPGAPAAAPSKSILPLVLIAGGLIGVGAVVYFVAKPKKK